MTNSGVVQLSLAPQSDVQIAVAVPGVQGPTGGAGGAPTQVQFNASGVLSGDANLAWDANTGLALGKPLSVNIAGAASAPSASFLGSWFTGGTSTTTKPKLLIEPAGTTSTGWSTSGTGLGINAASGFAGRLIDAQVNGTSRMVVTGAGNVGIGTVTPGATLHISTNAPYINLDDLDNAQNWQIQATTWFAIRNQTASNELVRLTTAGNLGINETAPDYKLDVNGTFGFAPGASVTPADNGDVVFELTNNTTLTIKAKGSDGVVRSVALTLA